MLCISNAKFMYMSLPWGIVLQLVMSLDLVFVLIFLEVLLLLWLLCS